MVLRRLRAQTNLRQFSHTLAQGATGSWAANPIYHDDSTSRMSVTLEDFLQHWDGAQEARLAADLMVKLWNAWFGWGRSDAEGVRFHPHLDILRYERARTIDELLGIEAPTYGTVEKADEPRGPHLDLLRRSDSTGRNGSQRHLGHSIHVGTTRSEVW